jgi:hypothetical protein
MTARRPTKFDGQRRAARVASALAGACCVAAVCACSSDQKKETPLTREQALDPENCRGCHADYYNEWSASMHAYAARDPVFLAMNRRGQAETNGALGNFCVQCHAPMAVRQDLTQDGLNLESLPASALGVTCYFCHNTVDVIGTHNAPLTLDPNDPIALRGGISDPLSSAPHHSSASGLLTGSDPSSATLCGACHDIQLQSPPGPPPTDGAPVELERTFQEWQGTVFAPGHNTLNPNGVTCGGCHMPVPARGAVGAIAPGAPATRKLHDHLFPGVDVALDGSPSEPNQSAVQGFLDTVLRVKRLCVEYQDDPTDRQRIRLLVDFDNVGAGHFWPSGAAQDRRAWVDVRVLVDDALVYSSGKLDAGTDVTTSSDPDLWLLRDETKKTDGSPAHMFWDVASITPGTIPGAVTSVVGAPGYDGTHVIREYPRDSTSWITAPYDQTRLRVEVRMNIQAVGYDVLDDLVASGHLDAGTRSAVTSIVLHPNQAFARQDLIAQDPGYARFNDLTFEWSALSLSSPYFAGAAPQSLGTVDMLCAGMTRATQ